MFISVVPLRPLKETLFYKVPGSLQEQVKKGVRLLVPLGRTQELAFVLEAFTELPKNIKADLEKKKIAVKNIVAVLDEDILLPEELIPFFSWVSEYYFYPLGEVIKRALPSYFSKRSEIKLNKRWEKIDQEKPLKKYPLMGKKIDNLNSDQKKAQELIFCEIEKKANKKPILLYGVTGSGKTEVYIASIHKALQKGQGALVLVPEIALTPQMIARFQAHFGENIAVFHSGLTEKERLHEWLRVAYKKVSVAIGVRSAIFLPVKDLGLIIIDEEHENTFKQDDRLRYNARDLAVLRGKLQDATVILGSATPSFESFYNAQKEQYLLSRLPKKACQKEPASLHLINLRNKQILYENTGLSKPLLEALTNNLKKGQQSLLFINRTGYSNFLLCEHCGMVQQCPDCSIALIYYKTKHFYQCSYCGYHTNEIKTCSHCLGEDLKYVGAGTEKIEEDLKKLLPAARIARLDRFTGGKREEKEKIIEQLHFREIDILVGTQMIARGLDFHHITVVGVISADMSLAFPDYKAAERTFQLLAQVSGRSGRGVFAGSVYIQTYNPEHYAVKYIAGEQFESFYKEELEYRKDLLYPPYARLLSMQFSGNIEFKVKQQSQKAAETLKTLISRRKTWTENIFILGPSPGGIVRIRNKYRYQILLKSLSPALLNSLLKTFLKLVKQKEQGVQITLDVDPSRIY